VPVEPNEQSDARLWSDDRLGEWIARVSAFEVASADQSNQDAQQASEIESSLADRRARRRAAALARESQVR
jgi:hypothetical protein